MKYNDYGQVIATTQDLCDLLYKDPNIRLDNFLVEDPDTFNQSVKHMHYETGLLTPVGVFNMSAEEFDQLQQSSWHMPIKYKEMDIAEWVLDQCSTSEQLQRVGQELILYQERNLFTLLQYLKYLVDTLRANNIVWGVGRGSSVASYVLYLIGVHKIDSIRYELEIEEFLK